MNEVFNRQQTASWLIHVIAHDAAKTFDSELKKHGLTIALWPTLMCLWEKEGITQRAIARKSKVENSTTTRTLDKLERLGLIERRPDPNSRRSFNIYLTENGRAIQRELLPIPVHVNQEYLGILEPNERKEISRLLKKIVSQI
ncbi:MarR family transcriptional regulator [Vibrio splendidus]|uniref:MarR family transcriptional regulator n=1 Tax=Vibrio splendidus TaxID=29497 RepID=A0A2N7FA56_VIBSP|nr:MarR family transcriptional regulator [Vibrio splendidus]PMJ64785.1 MarR family transcriptional regulator [Vibrio splendidus]